MQTSIIKIGNSKGLIIPQSFLKKLASEKVNIEFRDGGLFISPVKSLPRSGWKQLFKNATENTSPEGDFFNGLENSFDQEEWK